MADTGGNNCSGNDVVQLEAMRKDSFSWHPCKVSLCSRGLGLILQYGDNDTEEIITDQQEVMARIRVRSTPLQGDDCSSLRQGDRVLATKSSHVKSVFCDALVEEAIRVRHSKRIHCRCTFKIKWLHQEETPTVPASAIMKLSTESINLHPTISTFFSMLESSNDLDKSPYSIAADITNMEMDINVLLEKQIEEISNSTNMSQKKISKDFVLGLEVDLGGQSHGWEIDASLKEPCVTIPLPNNIKAYTGSGTKHTAKTATEIPQEEFNGSRSLLSPLAARAALASLRSNFPQSVELSLQSNVKKADDFSLEISAALGGKNQNFKDTAKTLFPASTTPPEPEFPKVYSLEKKNKISEKKIIQPSQTRFTRSQIQRSNEICESTRKRTFAEDAEKHNPSKRLTRSASVSREETEKNNTQPKQKISKTKFSESNELDLLKGEVSGESNRVKTTPNAAESVAGIRRKSATSKKQETRFSPRLRFLPRTRSQSKA
ncbi:hypothetical protein ABFS83_10G033500 [Erythranthe nasuta]